MSTPAPHTQTVPLNAREAERLTALRTQAETAQQLYGTALAMVVAHANLDATGVDHQPTHLVVTLQAPDAAPEPELFG